MNMMRNDTRPRAYNKYKSTLTFVKGKYSGVESELNGVET